MITGEWENAMWDSSYYLSAVAGPNLSPESVVAISSKKNLLCVWCVHICVCACTYVHVCLLGRGILSLHAGMYKRSKQVHGACKRKLFL